MKTASHHVEICFLANPLPLQNSAAKIFALLDIHKMQFIEKPLANQDFDFYWLATKDGAQYQVRGDSWEPTAPQIKLTVSVSGHEAFVRAGKLGDAASAAGWPATVITKSAKIAATARH